MKKLFMKFLFVFLILIIGLKPSWADDFVPFADSSSGSSEIRESYINLSLSDNLIFNKDSFYISNSCSTINTNRNLLFLTKKLSFSYCYPTWVVWTFTVPSDWVPGTDMYLDLNWFSLDNSVLGSVSYKTNTTWKLFYKNMGAGDKIITSFDNSSPISTDQAVNNLVDSLNSFKSVSFTSATPNLANQIVSTANNLVIKAEDITLNKQITLVIYREVSNIEDKVYPGINIHSARLIYSKKHFK